jgi:hypothetical protein
MVSFLNYLGDIMPIITMECLYCTKSFRGIDCPKRKSKFCSFICFSKNLESPYIEKNCITCSSAFKIKSYESHRKFCSIKCVRYTGPLDSLNVRQGFWKKANNEQKWQHIKNQFEKFIIKKDGCWGWKKALDKSGYARISMGRSKIILGHRASWIIHNGLIPDDIFVCHHCDNPGCTNPEHLFLGTPKDNVQDCLNKKRRTASSGLNHYNVKLTEDQVREIKKLLKEKVSQSKLGKKFNVSPSTIQNIADGKTWKHI